MDAARADAVSLVRRQGSEWLLLGVAASVLVLNLLDGVLTLGVVHTGMATESNPVMAAPLSLGSVWFMLAKLSMVSLGVALLWRHRNRPAAAWGLVTTMAVYTFVLFGYHVQSIHVIASTMP